MRGRIMLELNFKKKYKKTRAMIAIYCYDNTRDRPNEKAQKELERIIADMMLDEGWRKE